MCCGVCFHSTIALPFLVLVKLTGLFFNHPHFIISFIISFVFFCLLQDHFILIQPESQMPPPSVLLSKIVCRKYY